MQCLSYLFYLLFVVTMVAVADDNERSMATFNAMLKGDQTNKAQGDFGQFNKVKIKVSDWQVNSLVVSEVNGMHHEECKRLNWSHWVGWDNLQKGDVTFEDIVDHAHETFVANTIPVGYIGVTQRGPYHRFYEQTSTNEEGEDYPEQRGHWKGGAGYRVIWPIAAGPAYAMRCVEGACLHLLKGSPYRIANAANSYGGESCSRTSTRLCFLYVCSAEYTADCKCHHCSNFLARICAKFDDDGEEEKASKEEGKKNDGQEEKASDGACKEEEEETKKEIRMMDRRRKLPRVS